MVVRSWAELDLDDICAHARVFGFDLDNTLASSKQPMEPAMIARFSALTAHATVALISGGGMDVVTSQVLDVLGPDTDRSHLHVIPTSGSRYYRWDGERWTLVYAHDLDNRTVALPKEVATVITKRAKDTSTIAALSPSEPQLFLDKDYMVFTGNAEAEVVAEGEQKSSYEETVTPVVGKRFKVQTTTRVSNELQWADEDAQLEIISKIQADQGAALGRVLDYVVYHAFDPKKKAALAGFDALSASAMQVAATDDRVADLDSLAEAVNDAYDINGIALTKTMANELRKIRVPATGQRFYPEIPINLQVGTLDGINAATSGTVNGRLIEPDTGILAFLGDFSLIRWGMVRDIWSEIIAYGDPDNTGKDLKGVNQIAYRTEAVYSYAILDPKGISVLKKPAGAGKAGK